jgi:hypothetical protein
MTMVWKAAFVLLAWPACSVVEQCFPGRRPGTHAPKISAHDLKRARNKVPRDDFKGDGTMQMSKVLNQQLGVMARRSSALRLTPCEGLTAVEVHEIHRAVVAAAHPELQHIYESTNDNRRFQFCSLAELETKYATEAAIIEGQPELHAALRDSKCREAVMWYVHHLGEKEKTDFHAAGHTLPMLPVSPETPQQLEERAVAAGVNVADARVIVAAANESLQCSTCHNLHPKFPTPKGGGVNPKTGKAVPDWPDDFDVEFLLEVTTEAGQKGLPNISSHTEGNHFYYHYDRKTPENSRALNRHKVCPFFHTKSCDIYHQPDGIYLHINPGSLIPVCCKAFPVPPIPPYWTEWGLYVDTYEPGAEVGSGQAPLWEGFRSDRYIFGDAVQLDEHDLFVRADDPKALVRFHATLPPPNAHSHGYWHVMSDMNVAPQPDMSIFDRPRSCLQTCGLDAEQGPKHHAMSMFMAWAHVDPSKIAALEEVVV